MVEVITMKLSPQQKEVIKKAAVITGLGTSVFSRMIVLEKANEVLKNKNKIEVTA